MNLDTRVIYRIVAGCALLIGLWLFQDRPRSTPDSTAFPTASVSSAPAVAGPDSKLLQAYQSHARGVEVEGEGTVARVLPDDDEGARHQRFLVRLSSGHTILIAHNVDLAGRVEGLQAGQAIAFRGQYEWNERGGVVHWTHHDPSGRHEAGWIRYGGREVH